jgi:molybdopterin/thiamine biosynthesis adenylyltransferase
VSERRAFFRELAAAAREARNATRVPEPRPADAADANAARGGNRTRGDDAAPATAPANAPAPGTLSTAETERYSRQLVLPEWSEAAQVALREASVLVIGAGALGSPVATYLAGAGVGRLGIVDDDDVEVSNLHRQHLHFTPDVGVPKAESAAAKLRFLSPDVLVEPYRVRFDETTAAALVAGQDIIVDCSDSFATRYAVNAACCAAGVTLVEGGVVGTTGLVMSIRPGESACYRCAFPEPPPPGSAPTCAEAGVLGPAAGVIGSLQALEVLKLLGGIGRPLLDAFLQVELADPVMVRVAVSRRPDCPDCGTRTL